MTAVGYLGDPATLSEQHREQEPSLRTWRSLSEFVYSRMWGETSPLAR
jgi:hypothetical protein